MKDLLKKIIHFIKKKDNFLIISHINADGDAIASLLAIAYILEKWAKKYQIIIHDQKVDEKYRYLWGVEKIKTYTDNIKNKFDSLKNNEVEYLKHLIKKYT